MHDYRHPAAAPNPQGPGWRRLAPGLALGLVLAGASAVSLVHLTARWQEQAPMREAARQLRLRLEAEQQAREAAERVLPVATSPSAPPTRPVDEPYAANTYRSVEWLSEPAYTVGSDQLAPGFRDLRLEVEFRCTAGTDGRLHNCTAHERPAGSGLGRAVLPQLSEVRLRPMQVGGEYQAVQVGFSLSFDFRPKPVSEMVAGVVPVPPSAASSPSSEPMTDPDPVQPEPVPVS